MTRTQLPAEWIAQYEATWQNAGFVCPDGTLVGQEGRHREMLAALGCSGRRGYDGDTARIAAEYGLVRVSSYATELAAEVWIMPTTEQLAVIAVKAEASPRFSLEIANADGETVAWRSWDDAKPGISAIRAYIDSMI